MKLRIIAAFDRKITKATFKSFIKKALSEGNLWVKKTSSFDGTEDMVVTTDRPSFKQVKNLNAGNPGNSLGIEGLWLVGGGVSNR